MPHLNPALGVMVLFTFLSSLALAANDPCEWWRLGDPNAPFSRQIEFESYRDRTPPSLHGKSTEEEN